MRIQFFFIFGTIWLSGLECYRPSPISISEAIDRGLHIAHDLIRIEDPRLSYLYIKAILAHPNASFPQRYQAMELLALASNCSRHIDIERRSLIDILRSDDDMENQVKLLLYPQQIQDYRSISFDSKVSKLFHQSRLDDILTLSNALTSQYETLPLTEYPSLLQSYGIYHGRNGQFLDSKVYFELCVNATEKLGYESHPCSSMLRHTKIQLQHGLAPVIDELSHRILASRTISTARSNYQVVTKILGILRDLPNPRPPAAVMQLAVNTLFECKKYLYYHGWLTQKEMLKTMNSVMSQPYLSSDVYMIDTHRLTLQDLSFAEWRHNGSEYQFWLDRNQKRETCVASTSSVGAERPYVLRFVTNGMSAHNFGHANHDILWPFIVSHNLHHLFSRHEAVIDVIDIGIFLLKFLRIAYPNRTFVGFRSIEEVPIGAEEIFISGLGAPKHQDVNTIRSEEMKEVRSHMLTKCSALAVTPSKETPGETSGEGEDTLRILFIERNLTKKLKVENDLRYEQDRQEDHPALRHFYDSGYWSHTVFTSKRILGSHRRKILNFETLLEEFPKYFHALYRPAAHGQPSTEATTRGKRNPLLNRRKVEVIRFNPEEYDFCQQILRVSQANVVIGQHGAAMSLIGYANPDETVVIELESILNQIFQFISQGAGMRYRGISLDEYQGQVYRTKERHHITVDPRGLAQLVMEMISEQP